MDTEFELVGNECARGAASGEMTFPQIVARLAAIGVERYHADYSRGEITYYLKSGESHISSSPHEADKISETFSSAGVASAVGESQRGEHTYADFVRKTMEAGCVGYFVKIAGRRVIYFGRDGSSHVEYFPGATN